MLNINLFYNILKYLLFFIFFSGGGNNMGGLGSAMNAAASGLNAFGKGMNAISHNIANVSTAGFNPIKVNYQSLGNNMGVSAKSNVGNAVQLYEEPQNNGSNTMPPEALDPSGTDIASSFTEMTSTKNAFEANAVTIRTVDAMLGALVDMKV